MTTNSKTRLTRGLAATTIGLATAIGLTLGVSANPALADTTSPGAMTASLVKPVPPVISIAQKTREGNGTNPCGPKGDQCTIGPAHPNPCWGPHSKCTIRKAPPSECPPGEEYELLPTFPIELPGCGPPYLNADNWQHAEI